MTATASRMAAADRRRHLVETAIRLFTEGSYHGTTTAEIARAAGVSEPILYRHFASKRDLYLAALEDVWAKTRELWERKLDESTDACAAVEAIGKGHVSVRSPKLQLAELWVQALSEASEDPELKKHLRRHMREVHDFVADLVRRGQIEGAIAAERDADSEAWIMLAGGILGMVGRRLGLLDDKELTAIRTARLAWLRG
ncbi:MAG TPA: TetR/AcrR family transcriptional regulator [Gaiellaceae bacterium]|nr:TetR/AcrR family transcriptional regulator [Gaiellaceae bacterium]